MKTTSALLGLAATVSANIAFNHVPLFCNQTDPRIYQGCLRGMSCTAAGECEPAEELRFREGVPSLLVRGAPISVDGTCGPAHGNTVCDPNSSNYKGGCCSQYGWCGNTADHCGTGCISGCTITAPPPVVSTSPTAPRADGQCGKNFGGATCDPAGPYGGCCSQYGYCGSTDGYCLAANGCQSGCTTANPPPTTFRPDGRCGTAFGGAACDPNGAYGGCCSQYGYCGKTPGHCLVGNGCQSGCDGQGTGTNPSPATTTGEPVLGIPTTTPQQPGGPVTTDGTCGSANGNTVCGNWPNGNCCSMYGFCGNTDAHCGAGCQSGSCTGPPAVPAPGPKPAPMAPSPGVFTVVGQSGVPAMHAGLLPNGRVFFLDKLENYTQETTSDGYYALSSEYDPLTNNVVPLGVATNAFCSGGAYLADGTVVNVGGNGPLAWLDPNIGDGFSAIRTLYRSSTDTSLNGQSWAEPANRKLGSARWYASAQTMPDGTIFVASGSLNGLDPTVPANNNPTWEILNRDGSPQGQKVSMDILVKNQPYYMYPFIHLLGDGNLFVFTAKSSQVFNVGSNTIVKALPDLAGDYRTYPNTGGSVLLPLSSANGWAADIVVCGGGAYQDITSPCDASCGRIQPNSANPQWELDAMPEGRGMVEGTLLPDGTVVWLNGANQGAQGFGLAKNPTLEALLYTPTKPLGQRWQTLASSTIPRLYHSTSVLLPDGTMLVAGSNPVQMPILTPDASNPYVTEFRVEQYVPPYLQGGANATRPNNIVISTKSISADSSQFTLQFSNPKNSAQNVQVVLHHGGFVTHSLHMGQRLIQLDVTNWVPGGQNQYLFVKGPPNHNVAPPGPYICFILVDGVPGIGQMVTVV